MPSPDVSFLRGSVLYLCSSWKSARPSPSESGSLSTTDGFGASGAAAVNGSTRSVTATETRRNGRARIVELLKRRGGRLLSSRGVGRETQTGRERKQAERESG